MYRPRPAVERDLQAFHAEDYVHFLQSVTPDNKVPQPRAAGFSCLACANTSSNTKGTDAQDEHMEQLRRFCVGEDCPVFNGLYRYCQARNLHEARQS